MLTYLRVMRLVAIMAMILGWLTFSASAWAGCPMCASMSQPAVSEMQHDMPGMGTTHPMTMNHGQDAAKDPCSPGSAGHMATCSYCVVTPATVVIADGGRHVFAYPAPAAGKFLADLRPAPLAPPPRFL